MHCIEVALLRYQIQKIFFKELREIDKWTFISSEAGSALFFEDHPFFERSKRSL